MAHLASVRGWSAFRRWLQLGLLCRLAVSALILVTLATCSGNTVRENDESVTSSVQATAAVQARLGRPPNNLQSTPFDVGAVIRQVRYAYRAKGEAHEGGDDTYGVRVEAGRVTLTPYHYPDGVLADGATAAKAPSVDPDHRRARTQQRHRNAAPEKRLEGAPVSLETTAVIRGDVLLTTSDSTARIGELGELELTRGAVLERLKNSEQGVEQSWTFKERPAGSGDLVVRVEVRGHDYHGKTEQGLHFVGSQHGLGFRYGNAVWVDAKGNETSIEARWVREAIELRVSSNVVANAAYPAVLDPVVGPEFGMDQPVYGPSDSGSHSPAVAADGKGTSLVVWGAGGDIWGARVTEAGGVLDLGGIAISTSATSKDGPAVSHDGTNWLVVWQENRSGSYDDIYGARVSGAGAVLDANGIVMSTAMNDKGAPAVSHDGINWLVVWGDNRSGSSNDIYGTRVNGAGAVLDASGIAISTAANDQWYPAVSHDGINWLVVWGDERNVATSGSDIYGARVSAAGAVLDASGIVISTAVNDQRYPAVSHDGTNWLVIWGNQRSSSYFDVYGARVSGTGAVLDASGIAIDVDMIGVSVNSAPVSLGRPAVSHDGINWLVVWEDHRNSQYLSGEIFYSGPRGVDIYGARVSAEGTVLDPSGIIIATGYEKYAPAVAYDGTSWLVVWGDNQRGLGADLYGARVSAMGTAQGSVLISAAANRQSDPAASYDGTNWLVVWEDYRSGLWDIRLCVYLQPCGPRLPMAEMWGARVSGAGTVLDASGIAIATGAKKDRSSPAVSHDGTNWLVVWQVVHKVIVYGLSPGSSYSTNVSEIYGARVSAAGAVLDPSGITISASGVNPAIAHDGTNWLVVWQASGIQGARVSGAGAVLDASYIVISASGVTPAVSHDGTNWLVVWGAPGIRGARVSGTGAVLDPSGIAISSAANRYPAVSHDGTSWLVVCGGGSEIYGARVSAAGAVLDPSGIIISSAANRYPAVSHDGTNWLVVWDDNRSGSSDIFGARVSGAGAVLDAGGLTLSGGGPEHSSPTLASGDGGTMLLVYAVVTGPTSRVKARILLPDCTPTSANDSTCDGVDDNCNRVADEDYVSTATACGVWACASTGTTACVGGEITNSCVAGTPAASDLTCDGIDENCNGAADEDYVSTATTCGTGACASTGVTSCSNGKVTDSCVVNRTDTDGDAVADCEDQCPAQAGKIPDGCPDPVGTDGTPGTAEPDTAEPDTTSRPSDALEEGGCHCRAASSKHTSGASVLAILALAFAARRRRVLRVIGEDGLTAISYDKEVILSWQAKGNNPGTLINASYSD